MVYLDPDSTVRVSFPYDPSKPHRFAELSLVPPGRYEWLFHPGAAVIEAIPDFVVPYGNDAGGGPLFVVVGSGEVKCNADILTPTLWMLARVEEMAHGAADSHGRFPASASATFRCGCLERPIVDEYALALRQAISHLLPRWTPTKRPLTLKLSHDIDLVGLPRSLRS